MYVVGFINNSKPGPNGPISAYAWDFNGEGTSTQESPSFDFATAGEKSITLQVTSPDGTATITKTINIVASGTGGTPAPPPSGGIAGVGALEYNAWKNISSTNRTKYSTAVGQASDVSIIAGLSARSLRYWTPTVCNTGFSTGVPYTTAQSNGWLLKNASGSLMQSAGFASYLADIGLAAYQNAWITNILAWLSSNPGIDGVWLDTILYNPLSAFGSYPAKYSTQTAWQNAMISCMTAIYSALNAAGKYVMINAGAYWKGNAGSDTGQTTVDWYNLIGPHCDGLSFEFYCQNQSNYNRRTLGTAWYQNWAGFQRAIPTAQGLGRDFEGLMYGSVTDYSKMAFGKASFLLEWDGGGGHFMYKAGTSDPTHISWTRDIGAPSGAKSAVGVGFMRHFANGVVCVNPATSGSQTFSLGGAYLDDSNVSHSSITLDASTAMILHT